MFKEFNSSERLGLILAGIGTGGLAYLTWHFYKQQTDYYQQNLLIEQKQPEDVALQRTKETTKYFTGGLFAISLTTALMLQCPRLVQLGSGVPGLATVCIATFGNLFFDFKIENIPDTEENRTIKHLYFGGSIVAKSLLFLALTWACDLLPFKKAFMVAPLVFGGIGLTAVNSKSDTFQITGRILTGGLVAIGLANLFLRPHPLYQKMLVPGVLALIATLAEGHMKVIQAKARTEPSYDPMEMSLDVLTDLTAILVCLFITN
jgi:FtsH-binding integral membrane protein